MKTFHIWNGNVDSIPTNLSEANIYLRDFLSIEDIDTLAELQKNEDLDFHHYKLVNKVMKMLRLDEKNSPLFIYLKTIGIDEKEMTYHVLYSFREFLITPPSST